MTRHHRYLPPLGTSRCRTRGLHATTKTAVWNHRHFCWDNGKSVRYTKEEISWARCLRKAGLEWRPRLGDWFVTNDGFVAFVQGNGDGLHAKLHHTWLPHWSQCRDWLRRHGFTHPEFARDDIGHIRIEFIGPQRDIVSGTGGTDLACIYEIMSKIIERRGRPPT